MKPVKLPDFKIRYLLTAIFYLIAVVTVIQMINFFGVMLYGLDFLSWWPMGQSMLFGLGGVPDSTLTLGVSGLAIDLTIPGLAEYLQTHWLTRSGLSIITSLLFLTILGIFRRMLVTVDVQQPFDSANIRRVQLIVVLILIEMFGLDYLRTQSMTPVKALAGQMQYPVAGTDSSYQNADAYAYILVLLLLTLLAIFRRGVILYRQQSELEKQLYQKQKLEAVGTLASGIGHDFNNILTSIIGYAEMAKSAPDKADIEFSLDQVLDSSYRAKRLTQQIRAIGGQRHDAEQQELIDLKDEVNELLLSIDPTIGNNIKVVKAFDTSACYEIFADPTKIYQVLLNLCTNALQAMADKSGQLTIDIRQQERFEQQGFCLTVQDTGCGIDKQQQQQVFEPYFTTRKQLGGTGLGLSLSYSIVEGYGGHISVSSKVDQGSCFEVWLPKSAAVKHQTIQNQCVMVIDDDQAIVTLLKRRLSGLGYQVEGFTDCTEAMERFSDSPDKYDLLLTDFDMPQMSGIELAGKVQAIRADKPVVIVTATPEQVEIEQDQCLISSVISKPIAFSELHTAMLDCFAVHADVEKR